MLLSKLNIQRISSSLCVVFLLLLSSVLLRAGANINAVDNDGWTPLHAAAHWDKQDIIKFLVEKNADLDAKNYAVNSRERLQSKSFSRFSSQGQTPLDVCDGVTYDLLKEIKAQRPSVKVRTNPSKKRELIG